MRFHAFAVTAVTMICLASANAQVEHVPAAHPVYEFLDRMHTRGIIRGFSRAVLPMNRAAVAGLLRSAAEKRNGLSPAEQKILARFSDEFIAEDDGRQNPSVLFRDGFEGAFADREKFLYTWANGDRSTTFFMEAIGTAEYRTMLSDGDPVSVFIGQAGGRFRGTLGGAVGYGLQATNGTLSGDTAFARSDRVLGQTSNFGDWGNTFFDFSEAHIAAAWSWGSLSLGRERLLAGNGIGGRTAVGWNAPVFDAVRFDAHAGDFRFTYFHGFLLAELERIDGKRPYYADKYVVYHRAEADLFDLLRFGVFESVIYSERQVDPAYLNPINFYKSVEHAEGDRDNPMLGFDIQTVGMGGTEAYGSWTIDDVDFSKMGSGWWGNKFIWQAGVVNDRLIPNMRIGVEYTRIEPYVYSHVLRNNDYTHKNAALGLELPPNSDELLLHASWWPGPALSLSASLSLTRHGRNEYNDDGELLVNHGGEISERFVFGESNEKAPFLDGIRENRQLATASLRWEPVRNAFLDLTYRFRRIELGGNAGMDHFLSFLLEISY